MKSGWILGLLMLIAGVLVLQFLDGPVGLGGGIALVVVGGMLTRTKRRR